MRRTLVILTVGTVAFLSCGSPAKFDLTLRARTDGRISRVCGASDETSQPSTFHCTSDYLDVSWSGASGRRATQPARTDVFTLADGFGNVDCGGRQWFRVMYHRSTTPRADDHVVWELLLDDTSRLTLTPRTVVVVDSNYPETLCFDGDGTWRATDGPLRDHTGTFTINYDSVQSVLHLVED